MLDEWICLDFVVIRNAIRGSEDRFRLANGESMGKLEIRHGETAKHLFEAITVPAKRGSVNFFWLGQAGFAVRSSTSLLLIDVYLSNALADKYRDAEFKHRRMMPTPLVPDEVRGVDLLLASHAHSDHLDPGSVGQIMALNPDCRLICPGSVVPRALERGADRDRIISMPELEKCRFGPVIIEMIPSAHETLERDADGSALFAGFVIEIDGVRFYHSGDCVPYGGLAELLKERRIDLALLPVNGRDAIRTAAGILGNFTVDEAAELCIEAGIPILIPHHFGMFDFNTISPEKIENALEKYRGRDLEWIIPESGYCLTAAGMGAVPVAAATGD